LTIAARPLIIFREEATMTHAGIVAMSLVRIASGTRARR
jgi:hypothetical protein